MQVLVTIVQNADKADRPLLQDLVNAEFDAVGGHQMDDLFRQIWLRAEGSGSAILMETASADSAVN